ncbi:MAG: 16S rRNA (guanine(527)-N(7))-methyltransferase RsmG [Alphaproteobacteria bacterium]|nr:16S rRNA (guanine(527)-N(7))-methyltransferase RsmG [Alphaproteobacteria bacterium]
MEQILKYFPHLSTLQIQQFQQLHKIYTYWNERINLISRNDLKNLEVHHILHSLSLVHVLPLQPSTVFDLGTGGGFPVMPLAIYYPQHQFVAVDSIQKKIKVVDNVIADLALKNVWTRTQRFENLSGREADIIVCRAVAPLSKLLNWSLPVLKKNNNYPLKGLICLKGGGLDSELNDIKLKPDIISISNYFKEDYFAEKYILR